MEDSADVGLKKLRIEGNTWQETREGKNKINLKDIKQQSNCTVNAEDEKLTVTLTGTGNPGVVINCSLEAGTYFAHIDKVTTSLNIAFYGEDGSKVVSSNINSSASFTLTGRAVEMHINSGADEGNYTLLFESLYINEGEKDIGHEEYGAMPSTKFPSRIRSCGDNANLLNVNDINAVGHSITANGVDITFLENGAIKLNGTPTKSFSFPIIGAYQSGNNKLDLDGKYILSGLTDGCSMIFYNGTNKIAEFENDNVKDIKQKIDYAILSIKSNASFDNETIYPKLERGVVATPHSQFGQGNADFTVCNKNVLNLERLKSSTETWIVPAYKLTLKLKPNTKYTCSSNVPKTNSNEPLYFNSGSWSEGGVCKGASRTTTTDKNGDLYIAVCKTRTYEKELIDGTYYIQIEEGEKATDYEKHKEQNFTFPLKQKLYKTDCLAVDGIHHNKKEIVLDGTENWNMTGNNYYVGISDKVMRTTLTKCEMLCSHFKETKGGSTGEIKIGEFFEGYYVSGNRNIFFNYDNGVGGIENFKTYLAQQKEAGTPVTIQYELAEEELEEYSEEQKVTLNEMMKTAQSYKEKTHIFSVDSISPIFNVEYYKDIEAYVNSKIGGAANG